MRINPQEFQSIPKQLVIGFVPAGTGMERVQQALDTGGVAGDQVDFLSGDDGVDILTNGGSKATFRQRMIRKLELISQEGVHLGAAIDHLKAGNSMVAVRRVNADRAPAVRQALESAGVGSHHYFGRLTFD